MIKCPYCEDEFVSAGLLQIHKGRKHLDELGKEKKAKAEEKPEPIKEVESVAKEEKKPEPEPQSLNLEQHKTEPEKQENLTELEESFQCGGCRYTFTGNPPTCPNCGVELDTHAY